jgi:NTE family protein
VLKARSKPKVAFVATGGAARGIAHLGVLRACEELGVVPDIYVGTSSGAIIAATYGQGMPLDLLLDGYRLPWKRRYEGPKFHLSTVLGAPAPRDWLDPGYLLSGVFSIDRFERYLQAILPLNDFRSISKRLLITAIDIDRAERVVFGTGYDAETPISQAVAASCCAPLLFRPYPINGRFHIDGEVARTLSADLALEAGADIVIISNVYRPEFPAAGERSLARRGGLAMLHQTLNVLLSEKERRGVDLYARSHPRKAFIDIAPEVGTFGYLNRFAARSLVMRGYRAGLRGIAEAKERGVFELTSSRGDEPLN